MNRPNTLVQRQPAGDSSAASFQTADSAQPHLAEVDVEALADRVYRRLLEALRLERERGAWG